jgi:hypothetical protein
VGWWALNKLRDSAAALDPAAQRRRRDLMAISVLIEGTKRAGTRAELFMPIRKTSPALKHGGYSATALLPGEDRAAFEKLHRDLVNELTPNGRLEEDVVATIARLMWRKQNLDNYEIAQLAVMGAELFRNERFGILSSRISPPDPAGSMAELDELLSAAQQAGEAKGGPSSQQKQRIERAAEVVAQRIAAEDAIADQYSKMAEEVFEIARIATLNRLVKELAVAERLDAMIDRCLKRLLFLRGIKSLDPSTKSAALPSSPKPRAALSTINRR